MEILKQTILCLIFVATLAGCKNTPHDNQNLPADKKVSPQAQKQLLVNEVNKLKAIVSSGDKNKIADFFSFPLADSIMSIYTEDSSYNNDYKMNGDRISREMFLKYFPLIRKNLELDQLNLLFRYIKPEDLLHKNKLEYELRSKTEPCYKFYNIDVDSNQVTFITGSNTNTAYKNKSAKSDDEEFGDECEYAVFWMFMFNGEKLIFVRQTAAG